MVLSELACENRNLAILCFVLAISQKIVSYLARVYCKGYKLIKSGLKCTGFSSMYIWWNPLQHQLQCDIMFIVRVHSNIWEKLRVIMWNYSVNTTKFSWPERGRINDVSLSWVLRLGRERPSNVDTVLAKVFPCYNKTLIQKILTALHQVVAVFHRGAGLLWQQRMPGW